MVKITLDGKQGQTKIDPRPNKTRRRRIELTAHDPQPEKPKASRKTQLGFIEVVVDKECGRMQ